MGQEPPRAFVIRLQGPSSLLCYVPLTTLRTEIMAET